MKRRHAWPTASLLVLCGLIGCVGSDGGSESPVTIEYDEWDSAGIRIVESSDRPLKEALPWVLDTIPNLELGQIEDDTDFQFHRIAGLVGLPNGGLIVVDGGSQELRWFGASGEHLRTVGGAGEGPGEFLDPLLVPQFHTDSLLVFDRRQRSFTWVAIDGSGNRALGPGGQLFVGLPRTSVGSKALFRSAASERESCQENEGCEVPLLLRWVDVTGASVDTLAAYPNRMLPFTESGSPVLHTGSLNQRGVGAAGPDGLVVEGEPSFELRQFDPDGRLTAIFRVKAAPRVEPKDALDQYAQRAPNPGGLRRIHELMGLPEVVPAFQALWIDPLGWHWAELFWPSERGASDWLVFDPDGRARGMVKLPSGLEVHEIGQDYVLGVWVDELGVEYVRRHTLHRSGR